MRAEAIELLQAKHETSDTHWPQLELNRAIDICAQKHAEETMDDQWRQYQRRPTTYGSLSTGRLPVLEEAWGPQSLEYYRGLSRAQRTMLLHCRTGRIGLRAYLHAIHADPEKVRLYPRCLCLYDAFLSPSPFSLRYLSIPIALLPPAQHRVPARHERL